MRHQGETIGQDCLSVFSRYDNFMFDHISGSSVYQIIKLLRAMLEFRSSRQYFQKDHIIGYLVLQLTFRIGTKVKRPTDPTITAITRDKEHT